MYKVGVRKNAGEGDGEEAEVLRGLQGCLAHNKTNPPRNLPQAFAKSPRGVLGGGCFLMGEVPLYIEALNEPTLQPQHYSRFHARSFALQSKVYSEEFGLFWRKMPTNGAKKEPISPKRSPGTTLKGPCVVQPGGRWKGPTAPRSIFKMNRE